MRKFIFLLIIFCCGFVGWLSASYFRLFFVNDSPFITSESSGEALSQKVKPEKTIPLPPVDPDFVKSERQLISEILLTDDISSLKQILLIKDKYLQKALFEKYLEDISVADFPEIINALDTKDTLYILSEDSKFVRAIEVWLKRDFETAKDFVLEKAAVISGENFGEYQWMSKENHEVTKLLSVLCEKWLKNDTDECLLFVKENASLIPGISEAVLMRLSKESPGKAYDFLKEINVFLRSDGQLVSSENLYVDIFKEWVKTEPNIVLEKILTLESDTAKKQSIVGVIDSVASDNPSLALSLIREHLQGENHDYYIYGMYQRLSNENKEIVVDWVRQGDLSEEERNLALRGVATSMSAQELYEFLQKESLGLSEEEISAFIKQAFLGGIPFREGNHSSYGGSRFEGDSSEENTAAKVALFGLLNEEEKSAFFLEKSGGNFFNGREYEWYLSAYKTIPKENRDEKTENVLLYRAMTSNPKSAIDYYLNEMRDKGSENVDNGEVTSVSQHTGPEGSIIVLNNDLFNGMVQQLYLTNPGEAMAWIASIEDKDLRNRAREAVMVANSKNNVDEIIGYLNTSEDMFAPKTLLKQLSYTLGNHPDQLLKVVTGVQSELLSDDFWKSTMRNLSSVSEDEALGFIDDLGEKPALQSKAIIAFAENIEYKSPERALTVLLELPQSQEKDNLINRFLTRYADRNPEDAEAWKKRNNYK